MKNSQGQHSNASPDTPNGNIYAILAKFENVKQTGKGYAANCPCCNDRKRHLSLSEDTDKILLNCFHGCQTENVVKAIGLTMADLFVNRKRKKHPDRSNVISTRSWFITAPDGAKCEHRRLSYENGKKGFVWLINGEAGLGGRKLETFPFYGGEDLSEANNSPDVVLIITEGEKDRDEIKRRGYLAVGTVTGADTRGKAPSQEVVKKTFLGRHNRIYLCRDNDAPGRIHMDTIAQRLVTAGIGEIYVLDWPDAPEGDCAADYPGDLKELILHASRWTPTPRDKRSERQTAMTAAYPRTNLEEILTTCKEYLYLPDTGGMEITLATIAANTLPGDPVWLLVVGPPSSGKTEQIMTVSRCPNVHSVSTLTEASLLSGTPKRDSHGAKGGLLREMGDFGTMLIKDFGGVLSVSKEARGPLLAALREIYDGSWTRVVGSDGGRVLAWSGKAGLLGGATPTIDGHYAVMATLGERFCYYRLPHSKDEDDEKRAAKAVEEAGNEGKMRDRLSSLVAGLFHHIAVPSKLDPLATHERDKLVALATFTARCRSVVERDGYQSREIQLIPGVESPTRLVKVLAQLLRGLRLVGVADRRAWNLVTKVAFDSMPALRRDILTALLERDDNTASVTTTDLAVSLGYPANTTRRTLEDLTCYHVLDRKSKGNGMADTWSLTKWATVTHSKATMTLPEILKSDDQNITSNKLQTMESSISGKVTAGGDLELTCSDCGGQPVYIFAGPDATALCERCYRAKGGQE